MFSIAWQCCISNRRLHLLGSSLSFQGLMWFLSHGSKSLLTTVSNRLQFFCHIIRIPFNNLIENGSNKNISGIVNVYSYDGIVKSRIITCLRSRDSAMLNDFRSDRNEFVSSS